MTARALEAVLNAVERYGVPELHTRQALAEARNLITGTVGTHGALHQNIVLTKNGGGTMTLEVAHPFAMLDRTSRDCRVWRELLFRKHRARPSSVDNPWSLALYSDEVTPGAGLTRMPTRKSQAVYYSFLERLYIT